MVSIRISSLRTWQEGEKVCFECYCNEDRIADYYLKDNGCDEEATVERIKNTCKLIKLLGPNATETYHKMTNAEKGACNRKVIDMQLPEWNDSPVTL